MKGLRTQEGIKFESFFNIVQKFANRQNAVFFLKSGEGNEIIRNDFEGEDLFGWLIPNDLVEKFEKEFAARTEGDTWEKFETFANWEESNNSIIITFG